MANPIFFQFTTCLYQVNTLLYAVNTLYSGYKVSPNSQVSPNPTSLPTILPTIPNMRSTVVFIISLALALFALAALAAPFENKSDSPSLNVTLTQVGNTRVKAVVKNTGEEDVTFVHVNFFGHAAPVKKVSVYRNGMFV